jgi:hypothetical protein
VLKRMALKRVLGAVQRLGNATQKRSDKNLKRFIDDCNDTEKGIILIG